MFSITALMIWSLHVYASMKLCMRVGVIDAIGVLNLQLMGQIIMSRIIGITMITFSMILKSAKCGKKM